MRIPSILYWIGSGLLFAVSFVYPLLWWCFIPGLVSLFFLVEHEQSYRRVFWYGALVGTVYMLGPLFWLWNIYPIPFFQGQYLFVQLVILLWHWLSIAAVIGMKLGVFALATKFVRRFHFVLVLVLPFVWVGTEVLGSFLFSVYGYGSGSDFNTSLSLGYLGYALAHHPFFITFASLGGVYILSFLACGLCLLLYILVRSRAYVYTTACLALCMLLTFVSNPFASTYVPVGKEVVAVETYFDDTFSATQEDNKVPQVKEAAAAALVYTPQVIVLPEGSQLSDAFADPDELFEWASSTRSVIVDSRRAEDERGETVMRAYTYDVYARKMYIADKQYLVPQGEYTPLWSRLLIDFFADNALSEVLDRQYKTVSGMAVDTVNTPAYIPGVLFCFESMATFGAGSILSIRSPELIVHPVSHGLFHTPYTLWYQLDTMLQVQSVWQGIPIVSAGNMAPSKIYMPDGTMYEGKILQTDTYWSLKQFSF